MTNSIHKTRHQSRRRRRRQQLAATAEVTRPTLLLVLLLPSLPPLRRPGQLELGSAGIAQPVNQLQINLGSFPAKGSLINQRQGR